ncbi:MAG: hypothetical protein LBL96_12730 [Clostridiales bacterium]|jgi:hypothetical protein|nr:hypothetical protein [Clostridiales bacterium]
MNKSFLARLLSNELFPGSDIVRRFTFKMIDTRDSYALLAKANHLLAQDFAISGEESAHMLIKDCFECLSPHEIAA